MLNCMYNAFFSMNVGNKFMTFLAMTIIMRYKYGYEKAADRDTDLQDNH